VSTALPKPPVNRVKLPLWKRLAFGLTVPLVVLVIGEGLARLLAPEAPATLIRAPLGRVFAPKPAAFFRDHPDLFWELLPNLDRTPEHMGDRTDGMGLRNARTAGAKDARTRVVCLGDSCTYGLGLRLEETWPSVLGHDEKLDVINAGLPGYSSYQGLRLWEDRLEDLDADVVIVQFVTNDLAPWPTPQDGEWKYLTDRERATHLSCYPSPPLGSRLLQWLCGLLVLPEAESKSPGAPLAVLIASRPRVPIDEFERNVRKLASLAPRSIVVSWPQIVQFQDSGAPRLRIEKTEAYQAVLRSVAAEGHGFVDVGEVFRSSGLALDALFLDDVHATRRGCELVAEAVSAELLRISAR